MAAAKVFAVPELLETILKHAPFGTLYPGEISTDTREPERLFGLQRVSRDFRDTIHGSHVLRRLMFLEPIAASFEGERDEFGRHFMRSPLNWMAEFMDISIEDHWSQRFLFEVKTLWGTHGSCDDFDYVPEASWRRMQVANYSDSGRITVVYKIHVVLDLKDDEFEYGTTEGPTLKYSDTRIFNADATLGDVFETAKAMICRTFEEHADAIVPLIDAAQFEKTRSLIFGSAG